MANEITIPALPCRSIDETLAFYVALGFEITYQQTRPNNYGCVKYGDIDLHFFTLKGYEPRDSYSTCIVLVPDLAALHQTFSSNLRVHYGKLPIAGIPRISKLNSSNSARQLRFNIIDPGGNWIRFAQKDSQGESTAEDEQKTQQGEPLPKPSKLSRATHAADWLIEAKGEFENAVQTLDNVLNPLLDGQDDTQSVPVTHLVQALVLRASLAINLNDLLLARTLLERVRALALEPQDRAALAVELERADDLEKQLADLGE